MFTRTLTPLESSCLLRGSLILRCNEFLIDLGFKLTIAVYIDPGIHIEMIYRKALKLLGFVMRLSIVILIQIFY